MDLIKVKTPFFMTLFLLTFLISGCEDMKNPIEQYGDDVVGAHQSSKRLAREITLISIKSAVQAYYISNGRYPEDLREIETLMDSPLDLDAYQYNPENGEVSLKGD
jgi:hypothetical protein